MFAKATYDNLNQKDPADALMFGLPAALTGISSSGQSTSPLANPQRDASMMWECSDISIECGR